MKINKIKKEYQKDVLLSNFDLSGNDFTDALIESWFERPIAKNIYGGNSNINNFYISFMQIEMPYSKGDSTYYSDLNKKVQSEIKNSNSYVKTNCSGMPYNLFSIKQDDETIRKYLVIFISEKKSALKFDFSLISNNRDYFLRSIIEMSFKAVLLEEINANYNVNKNFLYGDILLNTHEDQKNIYRNQTKISIDILDGFVFKITYDKDMCGFTLKHQVFEASQNTSNIYDGISTVSKKFYKDKIDARTYTRSFLNLQSSQNFLLSKMATQLYAYQKLKETFDKLKITYDEVLFKPEYIFSDFYNLKKSVKKVNVIMQQNEYEDYNKKHPNQIEVLIEYIREKYNIDSEFKIIKSSIEEIGMVTNESYVFLMFDDKYSKDSNVIFEQESKWKHTLLPYFEKIDKAGNLSTAIQNFDLYSQIKLKSLYNIRNNKKAFVTQGWVLEDNDMFRKEQEKQKEQKRSKNKEFFMRNNQLYALSFKYKNKIKKIINEIELKKQIFCNGTISFDLSSNINTIRIVSRTARMNNKNKVENYYSHVLMTNKKGTLNIEKIELLIDNEIDILEKNYNISLNFSSEKSDIFIFVDDRYLIKLKDNSKLPFVILDKDNIGDINLNPLLIAISDVKKGVLTSLHRKSGVNENLLFPYILAATNKMLLVNQKTDIKRANCLIDIIEDKTVRTFMSTDESAMNSKMDKNNRIEEIELYEYKNNCYEKIKISGNNDLIDLYFKSLTFDLFSINQVCKKSLFTKIAEIVAVN